jgi:phage terminase large subunit
LLDRLQISEVFEPLTKPKRYKGAFGGRGSGKSHFFGQWLVVQCLTEPGTRAVCIREVQRTLAQSSKQLIESKIRELGVIDQFEITNEAIRTPGNGLIMFAGMQNHTAESIKSLEGCRIAWCDEAQALSERSLSLLRPTIRVDGSELWFSWNPTRKSDAVDILLRQSPPANASVVRANWRDNAFWNDTLEEERKLELSKYPERYDHVYEGGYATAWAGAYFAKQLAEAKAEKRITKVIRDPLLPLRAFFDIGGAGAQADAMSIWICQFVSQSIYVLDYIEGQGQVLAYYAQELRSRGYDKAICTLPHDGINANNITGKRYVDHLREAGFDCDDPVPNQGRGAAGLRIEAVRRIFNRCWFNNAPTATAKDATEAGRDALGFYHERKDEERNVGLGPEHDWSSHAADAFGLMAIKYEEPKSGRALPKRRMDWVA